MTTLTVAVIVRKLLFLFSCLWVQYSSFALVKVDDLGGIRLSLIGFNDSLTESLQDHLNLSDVSIQRSGTGDGERFKSDLVAVYISSARIKFFDSSLLMKLSQSSSSGGKVLLFFDKIDKASSENLQTLAEDELDSVERFIVEDLNDISVKLEKELAALRVRGARKTSLISKKAKKTKRSNLLSAIISPELTENWKALSDGLDSFYSEVAEKKRSPETLFDRTRDFLANHLHHPSAATIKTHARQFAVSTVPQLLLQSAREELARVRSQLTSSSASFAGLSRSAIKSHDDNTQRILSALDQAMSGERGRGTRKKGSFSSAEKAMTKMSRRWLLSQLAQTFHQISVESQLERPSIFRNKLPVPVRVSLNWLIQGDSWKINQLLQGQYDEHREGQVVNRGDPLFLPFTCRSPFTSSSR